MQSEPVNIRKPWIQLWSFPHITTSKRFLVVSVSCSEQGFDPSPDGCCWKENWQHRAAGSRWNRWRSPQRCWSAKRIEIFEGKPMGFLIYMNLLAIYICYIYIHIFVCVCIYIYCIYVYVYIYIYISHLLCVRQLIHFFVWFFYVIVYGQSLIVHTGGDFKRP